MKQKTFFLFALLGLLGCSNRPTAFVFEGEKFADLPEGADLRYKGNDNERVAYNLDHYYTGDTIAVFVEKPPTIDEAADDSAMIKFYNILISDCKEKSFTLRNWAMNFNLQPEVKQRCEQYINTIDRLLKYVGFPDDLTTIYQDSYILWHFYVYYNQYNDFDPEHEYRPEHISGDDNETKLSILKYDVKNINYKALFEEKKLDRDDTKLIYNIVKLERDKLRETVENYRPNGSNARRAVDAMKIIADNYDIIIKHWEKWNILN
jgi:hypothetical protein